MILKVRASRAPDTVRASSRVSTRMITTAAEIRCQICRFLGKNPLRLPHKESCVRPTDEHDDPLLTVLEKIPPSGRVFGRDAALLYLIARASSK